MIWKLLTVNGLIDIITAFKNSLKDIDWMDEKSAKAAAEKVSLKPSDVT